MHLTIVDDDLRTLKMYEELLDKKYKLELIQNPLKLGEFIKHHNTDLILLDLHMPQISGIDLYEMLKKDLKSIPVIFISSNPSDDSIVKGLNLGAEDFIVRPISTAQLISRIDKRIKKTENTLSPSDKNLKGKFTLNPEFEAITIKDQKYRLTTQEFNIINLLAQDTSKIHSLEDIKNTIWPETCVSKQALATHINNLRKKVPPLDPLIINKRGTGYYLDLN
jgi:DNA-binding response OmpR family regulator